MFKNLIFLFGMLPFVCFAQFAISGRALNQADTRPIPNASVFLGNAKPYAFFDNNGWLANNSSLIVTGALAGHRLAELLPVNYEAPHIKITNADTLLTGLANKMDAWSATNIREKIHLHLDRQWYGAGDTIWFKAYAVSG